MKETSKIKLNQITKRFGNTLAVNNLNLEVRAEEFLVLLGPSGSGKTTTLRCIAGLETPDEGEMYIGDRLVNDILPKDRNIAMVFQSLALYPHMNVFDNIAFPLRLKKLQKDEIKKRVKEVGKLLRIEHLLDRNVGTLSGGEAQRIALGRAIIRRPEVFLLDEPLGALDAKLRLYMRAELKALQKQLGTTTIMVTHDQAEAMSMGSRIAVMNEGRLQQVDNPANIYNNPANIFVAGFIGSPPMNFLSFSLARKKEEAFIDAGIFTLNITDTIKRTVEQQATSSELVLGFRPEDVSLHKDRPVSKESVEGNVYVIEPLGSYSIVDLKIGGKLIKVITEPSFTVDVGTRIWVSFDTDKIHIFDKKTGKNIV